MAQHLFSPASSRSCVKSSRHSKRQIKPHSRLRNIGKRERQNLHRLRQALGQIGGTHRTAMGLVVTLDSSRFASTQSAVPETSGFGRASVLPGCRENSIA